MKTNEYVHDPLLDVWIHPVTHVAIWGADMPWELKPEGHDE